MFNYIYEHARFFIRNLNRTNNTTIIFVNHYTYETIHNKILDL